MSGSGNKAYGVDIGGTGIKGAIVDLDTGDLATERVRILTPHPATPEAVADVVKQLVTQAEWTGAVGCAFPAVVQNGITLSAANVDESWVGADADTIFTEATGCDVMMLNDADAAGIAEVAHGAGKGVKGVVIMLTFGTGIGSALFIDGKLVPNTELGHLELDGHDAEKRASALVKENEDLSYEKWAHKRVQPYMAHVEKLFSPDLFIVGGGLSKKADKWLPLLDLKTKVVAATLQNEAGIVGAAMATL